LSGALQDIGQNPGWVIAAAASEEIKAALNSETDAARALGRTEAVISPTIRDTALASCCPLRPTAIERF
jgi:hypothetical protein